MISALIIATAVFVAILAYVCYSAAVFKIAIGVSDHFNSSFVSFIVYITIMIGGVLWIPGLAIIMLVGSLV